MTTDEAREEIRKFVLTEACVVCDIQYGFEPEVLVASMPTKAVTLVSMRQRYFEEVTDEIFLFTPVSAWDHVKRDVSLWLKERGIDLGIRWKERDIHLKASNAYPEARLGKCIPMVKKESCIVDSR